MVLKKREIVGTDGDELPVEHIIDIPAKSILIPQNHRGTTMNGQRR